MNPDLTDPCPVESRRSVRLLLIVTIFVAISELIANSVDPDQTPRSAASDQGLHCLPMYLLWDARHKRVNMVIAKVNIPLPNVKIILVNIYHVNTKYY